jgi:RNA polymerase sigma-70 factor (ECF subfamily)
VRRNGTAPLEPCSSPTQASALPTSLAAVSVAEARALELYRGELTGHCRRVLGSGFEAEDAVQETMMRAWRGIDRLQERAALRQWLYCIATNVCIDMRRQPQRRAQSTGVVPGVEAWAGFRAGLWPTAQAGSVPLDGDPAEAATSRDSIRRAFAAMLTHLTARQRAVLILRDALGWRAREAAELLGASVGSVNSALQRARAALADLDPTTDGERLENDQAPLLSALADSFERHDIGALVPLLCADAAR